ncbi:hypothetical protein KB206_03885 [Microvirga sp. STS02]|uniref:hypothetical protein n=1 Tax=Hymenobacter negativus TaxID=2795026 RepID=UPI0018DC0CEF|nr:MULTISPECIES: hypothetical protein [Bacteria]MBH8568008.1 hypothetical protein [Hymenobacter negativus]MBR7207744.1 hypothetical protein [Microvirga sp. STS02]
MKTSLTSRPATTQTRTALYLRALLLGGLAIAGSAGAALAQSAPSVKAKQADAQGLWLTVENPAQQRVQMQVMALDHGVCLVNAVNHRASYGSKLNFGGVPTGQYAVLLRVGKEQYRYSVDVQGKAQTTISVRELTPAKSPEAVAAVIR